MTTVTTDHPAGIDLPEIKTLTTQDLTASLRDGWADVLAAPVYAVLFAAVYVIGGLGLYFGLIGNGQPVWFVLVAAGFPLFAPFAALGFYEISRRRQQGLPLSMDSVLGAVWTRGDGQFTMMAALVLIAFGFWVISARVIFALFMGRSGIGFDTIGLLASAPGVAMLIIGTVVGGALALVVFALTAFSLPMLLDRPVDAVTAMVTSFTAVRRNAGVMLTWAAMIAGLMILAMVPAFLGLFLVLPLLGHATWHLYQRAIG